ncbi:MAG: helix-hairpin-helix domain-containing protein [Candidatus Brocadiia bacterium]
MANDAQRPSTSLILSGREVFFLAVLIALAGAALAFSSILRSGGVEQAGFSPATYLIPVNLAGPSELQALPRIGPEGSRRIIEYRTKVGPITSVEELASAAGISPKEAKALASMITFRTGKTDDRD